MTLHQEIKEDNYHPDEFSNFYLDAARDILPLIADTVTAVTHGNTREAIEARHAVVRELAAGILFNNMRSGHAADDYHLAQKFQRHGVDPEQLDNDIAQRVEEILYANPSQLSARMTTGRRSPVIFEAKASGGVQQAIVFGAVQERANLLKTDRAQGQRQLRSAQDTIVGIINDAKAGRKPIQRAAGELSLQLERLYFGLPNRGHRNSLLGREKIDTARHALDVLPMLTGDRRRLLTARKVVIGEHIIDGGKLRYELSRSFARAGFKKTWEALSDKGKAAVMTLVLYQDAPLAHKAAMALEDPFILKAFYSLPGSIKLSLSDWFPVGSTAQAVNSAASEYARQMTSFGGRVAHAASRVTQQRQERENVYKPTHTRPRIHSQINFIRLAVLGAFVIATLESCGIFHPAVHATPESPPTPTFPPTPSHVPQVDLIAALHPTLGTYLTQADIHPACMVDQPIYTAMQPMVTDEFMAIGMNDMETAIGQSREILNLADAKLTCFVSPDATLGSVYLILADGTILVPANEGLVAGRLLDNGVAIPDKPGNSILSGGPYPTSTEHFVQGGGGSAEDQLSYIEKLAPADLSLEKRLISDWWTKRGKDLSNLEFVPGVFPGSWVIVARDTRTGNLWVPEIKNDKGEYELAVSLSLFQFQDRTGDFFRLREIKNSSKYPDATQKLVADKSRWFVIGLYQRDTLVAWFDAGKSQSWIDLNSTVMATNTPETPRPTISPNLSPLNAASETYDQENKMWVVKNADGLVTATYTEETGWVYNWDTIVGELALREKLGVYGGDKAAWIFGGWSMPTGHDYTFPEALNAYLTPSSMNQWHTSGPYLLSDGTPLPWDAQVMIERSDGKTFVLLPALVRGVYALPNQNTKIGGTVYFAVYEFPAIGGSNFVIQSLEDSIAAKIPNISKYIITQDIPSNWLSRTITLEEVKANGDFLGNVNARQFADELMTHVDQMVLLYFTFGENLSKNALLTSITEGELMGNSQINNFIGADGILLP